MNNIHFYPQSACLTAPPWVLIQPFLLLMGSNSCSEGGWDSLSAGSDHILCANYLSRSHASLKSPKHISPFVEMMVKPRLLCFTKCWQWLHKVYFLHHSYSFPPVVISSEHVLSNLLKPSAGKRVDVLWMCVSENGWQKPKSHIPQWDYGINKCNYALHRCISLLSNAIKGLSMTWEM